MIHSNESYCGYIFDFFLHIRDNEPRLTRIIIIKQTDQLMTNFTALNDILSPPKLNTIQTGKGTYLRWECDPKYFIRMDTYRGTKVTTVGSDMAIIHIR